MLKYIKIVSFLIIITLMSCDNANDLLNQYIENGPIIYAAKIDNLETQSGFNRFRVNLFPAEDVNRSYCIVSWNIREGVKDSVKIDYIDDNYDNKQKCYYKIIDIPSNSDTQGNLELRAQNVDTFGNKSLVETGSAYIYGLDYISSLINAPVSISPKADKVVFEERVGAVGNVICYEQNSGSFTEEVYVTGKNYTLVDAKRGGIVRTKTRYHMNENDIDTLEVAEFLETKIPTNDGIEAMLQLGETSPFLLDQNRLSILYELETFSDNFNPTLFRQYRTGSDEMSLDMEYEYPILYCYRNAFDKVIDEVKKAQVENGSVAVWLLYNMGFLVKTPSGAFGVDIYHRWAEKLEPYLDFLCVTHNHGDHADIKLMDAMIANGKPVLSNFYAKGGVYTSKVAKEYTIGNFSIKTDVTDHLRQTNLPVDFVSVFRIECGSDAGNFSMLHCGDSGFRREHFTNVGGPVDMVVLRWGAPRENDILGTGSGQVNPDYAILSHLIELGHDPYPNGQASITQTLKHLPNVECKNTILPFWGEKITWKNGQMF
ncbi:DUF4998 domain-containing protein [Proteiniphilum sp. UBA5431]|uniref:DUF4998 domain-containing protein n=1 Tax=Proteiniphilum sp. UBA5431 TaxID=1947280 RepID=UPI00257C7E79|nr:DUF4998 domain-containing protein [Proteiniphilum sp. UBA5431]